jgi:hypothetical protein
MVPDADFHVGRVGDIDQQVKEPALPDVEKGACGHYRLGWSADIPVRSNFQSRYDSGYFKALTLFGRCCGRECPRSVIIGDGRLNPFGNHS